MSGGTNFITPATADPSYHSITRNGEYGSKHASGIGGKCIGGLELGVTRNGGPLPS